MTGYALGHPSASKSFAALSLLPGSSAGLDGSVKQDTLYWAYGTSFAELAVDRGQYLDDMAVGTNGTSEASPANRFNLTNRWCWEFKFTASSTDTGRLFEFDCVAAASDLSLQIIAGGIMRIIINNGVAATTLTLPGISGTPRRFVFSWSAEPNEDTTGAADALRHHLCAWNLTTGEFDKVTFTTVVRPGQTGGMFVWTGGGGSNVFTGKAHAVRLGSRLHPPRETANDFVGQLAAPTTETDTDHQGLPVSSALAGPGRYHGPDAAWVADATRRLTRRTFSPLWNEPQRIQTVFTDTLLDSATDPWIRGAPDSNTWRMHLTFRRGYRVPPGATHLWVRVHAQIYNFANTSLVTAGLRLYSMNKHIGALQAAVEGQLETFVPYFVQAIVVRDDTPSGEGSYVIKAKVPISKSATGWTYLALALAVDPNSSSSEDARTAIVVKAVHTVPCAIDAAGGLDFGEVGS